MTWLLDANVLVALLIEQHVHHERAHQWFGRLRKFHFATCPFTQGAFLRIHMREAEDRSAAAAWSSLAKVHAHPAHQWWGEGPNFVEVPHRHLQGPAQVTDAWLAELARRKNGRLATLDTALARLHADVAHLLPN